MADVSTATPIRRTGPSQPYSGNAPLLDEDGYAIASITTIEQKVFKQGTKDEWQCFRWLLRSEGTLRPWYWSELTVQHLRPPNKDGEMNALATWMVCLGLRSRENLKPEDVSLETLQAVAGRVVRFRVVRKDGYYRVHMPTLTALEP